jgi:hypothetical protein
MCQGHLEKGRWVGHPFKGTVTGITAKLEKDSVSPGVCLL